ncbi:DotU family type IV/VI secretion system protein [Limnobaculum zhutongyuii]|uniref:DotU family type IV/VI secretion system protein n=1 Tax=Limnobaculum zhutongyuii TaxID=2498113 RepID=A0A411WLK1_9GAMM|nr:type IVB secretion system protein IcmH/DotU [Limnobaculum zhutongyuii]QBH97040.1 DotU family type IV/VI secretion system protein [Limnobaculum zhutongyuii]TQS87410.1 DotU family type IV/VI secretion system protein [Limnobaculum zhutongyuii]
MSEQPLWHGADQSSRYLNKLEQYSLTLRGRNVNPIIDAATPLLGMILRMQDLSVDLPEPDYLYRQVQTDIESIEQFLEMEGYEPGSIVTFRYVLCTFIDECVMSADSSLAKYWSHKSLLIHFHNEGWGGERVFQITERLMNEPKRYKDMLEFIYLCFGLGFRGRYKVQNANNDEFERLFRRLQSLLQSLNGEPASTRLHMGAKKPARYFLPKQLTTRHIVIGVVGILLLAYFIYLSKLNSQSASILEQLNMLLK